jgi:hypothetical protein
MAVARTCPPLPGIGGAGPMAVARTCPPLPGIGGAGPMAVARTCPPLPGIGGAGPMAVVQIAEDERLEAENVAAFPATMFRSPIAPIRTSNTKATTVRHLDIHPPRRKLTRRNYMFSCFTMKQNSALCLNDKHPWTMSRWTDSPGHVGAVSPKLSTVRVGRRRGRVNGTIVLIGLGTKVPSAQQDRESSVPGALLPFSVLRQFLPSGS